MSRSQLMPSHVMIAATFLVVIGCRSATIDDPLVGTWELVEWTAVDGNGQISYPYGDDAQGLIMYSQTGEMMMILSATDRDSLGTFDLSSLDHVKLVAAFDNFFAYYGTYEIDRKNNTVKHRIEGSSFPDWTGGEQQRQFELRNNQLVLRATQTAGLDHSLTWRRK